MPDTVLIIAAHPDDEVLGVGGTSARHAAEKDDVHVLIIAEGGSARHKDGKAPDTELRALRQSADRAAEIIGTNRPRFAGLPDNRLDGVDLLDIVKVMERVIDEVRPSIVYTHHGGDLNIDHEIVHRAALTACRPLPGQPVRAIYTFETPSSSEWGSPDGGNLFRATHFVETTLHQEKKRLALQAYSKEMRPFPHARSIESAEALARLRGSQIGVEAAEAFGVIRHIRKDGD